MEYLSVQEKIEMVCGESGSNLDDFNLHRVFSGELTFQSKRRTRFSTVTAKSNEIYEFVEVAHNPHISTRETARDSRLSVVFQEF